MNFARVNNGGMKRAVFLSTIVVALAMLSGCGGGGGSSESGAKEIHSGTVSALVVGEPKSAVHMSGEGSTISGLYGASFLNVSVNLQGDTSLNDPDIQKEAPLGLSINGRPGFYDFQLNRVFSLSNTPSTNAETCDTSFSASGQFALSAENIAANERSIYLTSLDGLTRTRLTTGNQDFFPTWSVADGKIAFERGGDVYTMTSSGASVTNLTSAHPNTITRPKFSPDGTKIGFLENVDGVYWFSEIPAAGGAVVSRRIVGSLLDWDYVNNADEIVILYPVNATETRVRHMQLVTGAIKTLYTETSTTTTLDGVAVSPGGSLVAVKSEDSSTQNLLIIDLFTGSVETISNVSKLNYYVDDWMQLPRKKFFINPTAAVLHTNAAGFLFGTKGSRFTSMLAVDAQTRNNLVISNAYYVSTITASDKITMLRFANSFAAPRVTIIDPANVATHAQGAIVNYEAATGTIKNVLTFTRSRNGSSPTSTVRNGKVTFTGDFVAAFDSEGKKIADRPTTVEFDQATAEMTIR